MDQCRREMMGDGERREKKKKKKPKDHLKTSNVVRKEVDVGCEVGQREVKEGRRGKELGTGHSMRNVE